MRHLIIVSFLVLLPPWCSAGKFKPEPDEGFQEIIITINNDNRSSQGVIVHRTGPVGPYEEENSPRLTRQKATKDLNVLSGIDFKKKLSQPVEPKQSLISSVKSVLNRARKVVVKAVRSLF